MYSEAASLERSIEYEVGVKIIVRRRAGGHNMDRHEAANGQNIVLHHNHAVLLLVAARWQVGMLFRPMRAHLGDSLLEALATACHKK
jgi:hypothetical protein